jgi:hypothetical protein
MFEFLKRKQQVNITAINILWKGKMHSMEGIKLDKSSFELKIPFQNIPDDVLPMIFKAQQPKPVKILSISVPTPFKITSVSPALPANVMPNNKIEFKLGINAPQFKYNGPMNIEFKSVNEDMVHIELTKVIYKVNGEEKEMPDAAGILDVIKNQIFMQSAQLRRILDVGVKINSVSISEPFKLVGTDPKVPVVVESKESMMMSFYILAPGFDYAGPMVINITSSSD